MVLPADAEDEVVHEAALALARSPRAEPPTPATAAGRATVPLGRAADRAAWRELGPDVRLLSLFRLWATFDRYYPYKHLLDEPWGDVLVDLIPVFLAAAGREGYQDAVRLSLARTRDGHTRLAGAGPLGGPATVPLPLAVVEGKVVVVAAPDLAVETDIRPGDVVVAVDGRAARERFDALAPFVSSSTRPGLELVVARHLLAGPVGSRVTVTLRRAEREWDVTLDRAEDAWPATRHPIGRTDLPVYTELTERVGYADLDRLTNAEVDTMLARFRELPAIVLDMRGYPNYTMPLLADRLADGPVVAAQMRLPVPYDDQHDYSLAFEHVFGSARPSSYDGRIVVLVNVEAISQAEHTCLVLERAAPDVTFIGRPTRGANGDVTVFEIPGGLSVTFTGWGVRHADGTQLQRRGIQPDIVAAPTIVGLREGRDEVLEAALAFLEQSPPSGAPVDR